MTALLINSFSYLVFYWTSIGFASIGFTIFLLIGLATKSFTRNIPRIIFLISLSSTIYALAFILVAYVHTSACTVIAAMEEFGYISSLLWSCFFSHAIKTILEREDVSQLDQYMNYYYILGVILPLPFVAISIVHDLNLSPEVFDNQVCYQALPMNRTDYKYPSLIIAPLLLAIGYWLYCFVRAKRSLHSLYLKIGQKGQIRSMTVYPMIVALCWAPLTVANLVYLFKCMELNDWNYWMELLARMPPFFIGIVYIASTKDVKRRLNSEECEPLDSISKKPFFNDQWLDAQNNSFNMMPENHDLSNNSARMIMEEIKSPLSYN